MNRRLSLFVIVLVALGALWWTIDALHTSSEEQIEEFVDQLEGHLSWAQVQAMQSQWVDLDAQPLEVAFRSQSELYRKGQGPELNDHGRKALKPYFGTRIVVLQKSIEVDDAEASVALRLLTDHGLRPVQLKLSRHGSRWLIQKLSVR